MKFISYLFVIVTGFAANAAEFTSQCAKFPQPLTGAYCIYTPTGAHSRDILYYFHGLGGQETYWGDENYYTAQVRSEWSKNHERVPTVISVSFGPVWLLAEKNASPYSGLLDVFTEKIMPMLEGQLGGLHGKRLIVGESMGGFNTLQVALKTRLFAKAAALCAPMAEISPFSSQADIDTYVKASRAYAYYKDTQPNLVLESVQKSIQLAQTFFPTPEDWAKGDPLQLVNGFYSATRFYLAIGFYDQYASYDANMKLGAQLTANGVRTELRPQWGGHCAMDIPSLAHFLVH